MLHINTNKLLAFSIMKFQQRIRISRFYSCKNTIFLNRRAIFPNSIHLSQIIPRKFTTLSQKGLLRPSRILSRRNLFLLFRSTFLKRPISNITDIISCIIIVISILIILLLRQITSIIGIFFIGKAYRGWTISFEHIIISCLITFF